MIQIFVSYSHKDSYYLANGELIAYLKKELSSKAIFWYDDDIVTGDGWNETIHRNILNSQIAILLISNNFIQSDYINKIEVRKFFTATIKKFVIFPVIISACNPQKIEWLKELQYIPAGEGKSIEEDFPAGKLRNDLYKKILHDLEKQVDHVEKPVITAGQALAALINLINTIESELLVLCNKEELLNNNHSLMFEGRSTKLYAKQRFNGAAQEYLKIIQFEDLERSLLPDDYACIMQYDKILSENYSKWFALEARHSLMNTKEENSNIRLEQSKIIIEMFPSLIRMLEYINKIGFDLNDHYWQIYEAMNIATQTKSMISR